jgi:hypothetical protein
LLEILNLLEVTVARAAKGLRAGLAAHPFLAAEAVVETVRQPSVTTERLAGHRDQGAVAVSVEHQALVSVETGKTALF